MVINLIKKINTFITDLKAEISEGRYNRSKSKIDNFQTDNSILQEEAKNYQFVRENKKLRDDLKIDKRLIRSGKLYSFMAFLCFVSNLGLSIAGGCTITTNYLFIAIYIVVMIVLEGTIYLSAKSNTDDKKYFFNHYTGLTFFRGILMITSISLNILFFHNLFKDVVIDIIMSPLCLTLGFLTLKFSSLGYDKKHLNFHFNIDKEKKSTMGMLFTLITYSLRNRIEQAYNSKVDAKNSNVNPKIEIKSSSIVPKLPNVVQEISNNVPELSNGSPIISNDVPRLSNGDEKLSKDVQRYLSQNFHGQILTSENIIHIRNKFGLSDLRWRAIKKYLPNLEINGKRSKVI